MTPTRSLFVEHVKILMNQLGSGHAPTMPKDTDMIRAATLAVEDGLELQPVAVSDHHPMPQPDRHAWLEQTAQTVKTAFISKYQRGQAGHGCDLGTVTLVGLLEEMESEALDQLAYVRELKRRLM